MEYNNLMLDLETMGTGSKSVVTAIGATYFDPETGEVDVPFYATLSDWEAQINFGHTMDVSTIKWWLKQSEDARSALLDERYAKNTAEALFNFGAHCESGIRGYNDKLKVWGNGSDFDNVILGNLFKSFGLMAPWKYSNNRCYRTLKALMSDYSNQLPEFEGERHNALHDAIHQAKCAIVLMRGIHK